MENTFLVFAFSISSNLLRRVCIYGDKTTALLSLSFPLFGCQVDRLALRLDLKLCRLIFGALFGLVCLAPSAVSAQEQEAVDVSTVPILGPLGLIWEAPLSEGKLYYTEVAALLEAYELQVGAALVPGTRGKVGIKVNTRGGRGMSTSLQLLRAVIEALEARGFARESILIVDYSEHQLRQAGIMPALSSDQRNFEGCPVLALDSGLYYDPDWFYDSPLPPSLNQEPQLFGGLGRGSNQLLEGAKERKSFLAAPLLFDVDFWVNLAVGVDDAALGVDGALVNATLWNVSNSQRFLNNGATASAAVAEIAAIPELHERMVLHFVSLDSYQYIGGPYFKSRYTRSEPLLWMSSDPVAIDRLLYDRMNALRLLDGFPEITPLPRQLPFAASLGLGVFDPARIELRRLDLVESAAFVPEKSGEEVEVELLQAE
jgi:hypothetical protein